MQLRSQEYIPTILILTVLNMASAVTLNQLNAMGHKFGPNTTTIGNVQSILIDCENGIFKGVADSSRNGAAIGVNLKGSRK